MGFRLVFLTPLASLRAVPGHGIGRYPGSRDGAVTISRQLSTDGLRCGRFLRYVYLKHLFSLHRQLSLTLMPWSHALGRPDKSRR